MIRRGARRLGAGALLAFVLSACHASATVAIRVHADGTGTVTVAVVVDRSARAALAGAALAPKPSASALPAVPLGDLRARGWSVGAWRPTKNGGASIALSKPFSGAAALAGVLAELDGRDGALRDVKVQRSRSLLRDRDSVSLVADLRHLTVGVADDQVLASRLRAAGVDVAALDRGFQSQLGTAFDLSVAVVLPDGSTRAVVLKPGATRLVTVASTSTHVGRLLALVAAGGVALLGLLLFLAAALNARRSGRF